MPRTCFVIIPFKSELNYFYLYIQKYLREKHGIDCERGDHRILTIPLLEKIKKQILDADVIIGDITGRNPNVFYELGLADAYGKNVILITQDPISEAPADIRHLEFIKYDLTQHVEFLNRLDNAIHNVFVERYRALYESGKRLLQEFNSETGLNYPEASEEEFQARVALAERTQGIPTDDEARITEFLLPRIIRDSSDINVMRQVTDWLERKFAEPDT